MNRHAPATINRKNDPCQSLSLREVTCASQLLQDVAKIHQVSPVEFRVDENFVPNMRVPGCFYVNDRLKALIFDELKNSYSRDGVGGFLPAVTQLANVAALPGIVEVLFHQSCGYLARHY